MLKSKHRTMTSGSIESLEPRQLLSRAPVLPTVSAPNSSPALVTAANGQISPMPRVISYLPDYRYASTFSSIDWNAITQIDYFSYAANASGALGSVSTSGYNTSQLDSVVTAAHAHGVTASVVIDPGSSWTTIDASTTLTNTFVSNLSSFVTAHKLDGVDLDYEPSSLTPTLVTNYGNLINAIHSAMPTLRLSSAVNPEITTTINSKSSYVVPNSALGSFDTISLMCYDLDYANHSTYARSTADLAAWGTYVTNAGYSKTMLTLGVPFYGRSGTSWSNSQTATYADIISTYIANTGAAPSPSTDSITETVDGVAGTWYFNGPTTMQEKTAYVLANGYGGIMTWELGQDHYTAGAYDATSLLPAIKSAMGYTNFASLSSGALTLTGDSTANTLSLSHDVAGDILVTMGDGSRTYLPSLVSSITFNGEAGNDTLNYNGTFTQPITFDGTGSDQLNINSGTFTAASDLSSGAPTLAVNIASGASAVFNSTQHLAALNLTGTASATLNPAAAAQTVLVTNALSIDTAHGSKLDLRTNAMVVNYSGSSPLATLTQAVAAGYNGGLWNAASGITSSSVSTTAPTTAIGILDNAQLATVQGQGYSSFAGVPVSASSVLIRYTLVGDADLDGGVGLDDFNLLASHLGSASGQNWLTGDFNYDGGVGLDDFNLLATNFGKTLGASGAVLPATSTVTLTPPNVAKTTRTAAGVKSPTNLS